MTCQYNKSTIVPFTNRTLSAKPADVTQVKIWTDGPVSQFKNQYVMVSMNMLPKKHSMSLTWNFSATSHGKGPIDGVGATLKVKSSQLNFISDIRIYNYNKYNSQ